MANAIKRISVARGYDVTGYTLQCFGGAGGQHACLVADALGMQRVLRAPAGRRAVGLRHGPGRPDRDARGLAGAAAGRTGWTRHVPAAGRAGRRGRVRAGPRAWLRRTSSAASACTCATRAPTPRWWWPLATPAASQAAFEPAYRQRFAFLMPDRALVIEAMSVEAVGAGEGLPKRRRRLARPQRPAAAGHGAPCRCERRHAATPGVRPRCSSARAAARGRVVDGPGGHRRAQRHHGGRARLAGGDGRRRRARR
jgi:5-oxoprolinase (ATP-hydrolysing)